MTAAPDGDDTWDVVVVGAGPAGSAAALGALAADPSLRVLLVDRADFPRDKCCGDGIAPHVLDILADVGVRDVTEGWEPLRQLEIANRHTSVAGRLARPVWVIPREVFDARLVERARSAGARVERRRVASIEERDGVVVIDETVRARVVVGADGAHSVVRRSVVGDAAGRSPAALAIRGYVPTPPDLRGLQLIRYGDRRQPAYAWCFDRGDGLANVGYGEFLPERDAGSLSRRLLLEQLERLIPGSVADGVQWRAHHLPLSGLRWTQPSGPVLLAGDAAGLVNPMTGEGIFYAVLTGVAAGRAAAGAIRQGRPASAGATYRRSVQRALAGHLRHTWLASRLTRHEGVVTAGIRASSSDRRVFDDLVEIGLGRGRITPRLATGLATQLSIARTPSGRRSRTP
ncbi:NAD(P)/FAD-dependent oxidoreductase [Nocardioides sp. URHA0020]|uniref:NAD(P)/FAD-dependent oxidoreductase n=1 Tax=Nocardioides sp. URHA0020 TaxID=1380392 RepID=UPI0005644023|nr:geranylgeranyl reductase family protein [Nocardioides sp. URHA0020]